MSRSNPSSGAATGSMNDSEMQSEMNKMVAFIAQEAREKAREIQVKADEEFAIEKAKIVRQEQSAIDADFDKKKKQAEVGWKIAKSTALNKSRLSVLRERENQLQTVFEDVKKSLKELKNDKSKYEGVVENLILEALLMLMNPEINVSHLADEESLVQSAGDKALKRYKEVSGRESKITYSGDLPTSKTGGIVASMMNNKIRLDNTLDERLSILEEHMLPEIRTDLFGPNESRKFFN